MQWSPVKEKVFQFATDIMVSAGAGSGKTAALVELYVRLLAGETALDRPLSLDDVVAITFTDKAATEMKERVRAAIRQRVEAGCPANEWEKMFRSLAGANIATFHSFCSRILQENPAEAGIDPAFVVFDAMAAAAELEDAVDQLLAAELENQGAELKLLLSRFAFSSGGQGKGLREHLLELHARRYGSGHDDATIVAAAEAGTAQARELFAAAARDLAEQLPEVDRLLAGKPASWHGLLRQLPGLVAAGPLDPADPKLGKRLTALRACIAGNWGKEKPVRDELVRVIDLLAAAYHQVASAPYLKAFLSLVHRLEDAYRARKDRFGALDFEDLLVRTRDLLRDDEAVRERYRKQFAAVMVDEFQDTNPLQKELLECLCGPGQRLFIVGDPKQSIYLFRGADVGVSVAAQAEMARSGGEVLYFQESFRSRQGIIDFVNAFFAQVMAGGTELYEVNYGPGDALEPKRADWDEAPCVELLSYSSGGSAAAGRAVESELVAERIRAMVGQQAPPVFSFDAELGAYQSRPVRYGDIAILFRRFTNLKVFEAALRQAGIPYYVVKGKGFYRCQEVLDLLNFLRYLEYGEDLVALAGLLRSPLCGVSDETLLAMGLAEGGLAAWAERINTAPFTAPVGSWGLVEVEDQLRVAAIAELVARLKSLKDKLSLPELLEELLLGTDYCSILLTTFQGEQKVANLRKLIELSRSFENTQEGTFRRFINYLTDMVEAEPTEAEAVVASEGEDVVRLMTIHQSKGLEFPVVFVPEIAGASPSDTSPIKFCEEFGLGMKIPDAGGDGFPTLTYGRISALQKRKEQAEQKRLLYVAATRARDYLVLSGEGNGEWRKWLDAFCTGDQRHLVRTVTRAEFCAPAAPLAATAGELPCPEAVRAAAERVVAYTARVPNETTFSTTALRDYRHCARKYYYKAVLGLEEGLFTELLGTVAEAAPAPDELSALEKGELIHRMLEVLDFSATPIEQREAMQRVAEANIDQPRSAAVDELIGYVLAFAGSPFGQSLASKQVWREFPFALAYPGQAGGVDYFVRGVMDLVVFEADRAVVYDYKYRPKSEVSVEEYRFQLQLYMLALARGTGLPTEGHLLFLQGCETAEVSDDLEAFEAELLQIMGAIHDRTVRDCSEHEFTCRRNCNDRHCPFYSRCGRGELKEGL